MKISCSLNMKIIYVNMKKKTHYSQIILDHGSCLLLYRQIKAYIDLMKFIWNKHSCKYTVYWLVRDIYCRPGSHNCSVKVESVTNIRRQESSRRTERRKQRLRNIRSWIRQRSWTFEREDKAHNTLTNTMYSSPI